MQPSRSEVLERERRWAMPVALATLTSFALLVVGEIVVRSISGEGPSEILESAHTHSSAITLSAILKAAAFVLLVAPLVYLFRAAQGRSPRVRGQLIGLIIAAPLFLSGASVLTAVATNDAASEFVAGEATTSFTLSEATERCRSDRESDAGSFQDEHGAPGAGSLRRCARTEVADEKAEEALSSASTRSLAEGLGLGGRLGLAFALIYGCLWSMRTGLLTRFWGSLGMAMGVAAFLLLIQFTFVWFLYFGLLVAGWVPGGRPPAWETGEAMPWPTPGEKAASEIENGEIENGDLDSPELPEGGVAGLGDLGENGEPRKRKERGER